MENVGPTKKHESAEKETHSIAEVFPLPFPFKGRLHVEY